jgi:hypothetical protein
MTVAACVLVAIGPTVAQALVDRAGVFSVTPTVSAASVATPAEPIPHGATQVRVVADPFQALGMLAGSTGDATYDLIKLAIGVWLALGVLGFVRDTLVVSLAFGPRRRRRLR